MIDSYFWMLFGTGFVAICLIVIAILSIIEGMEDDLRGNTWYQGSAKNESIDESIYNRKEN